MKKTNEKERERLAADIARFTANGGAITEIPLGLSGEQRVQMKSKAGRQVYAKGDEESWRKYDRVAYEKRNKKE